MIKKLIQIIMISALALFTKQIKGQEKPTYSKVYVGINGSMNFLANTLGNETINSSTIDATVRSNSFVSRSGGGGGNSRFITGYRLNEFTSLSASIGLGVIASNVETDFSSSEKYSTGTYRASDYFTLNFSFISYEALLRHKLVELNMRRKLRFFNARFGLGVLKNKNSKGLFYRAHFWPPIGITIENSSDETPASYKETVLMKVGSWPYAKLGLEYESRGGLGITYSFDAYWYRPNLFSDYSVRLRESHGSNTVAEIGYKENVMSYSVSIGFFFNRSLKKDNTSEID